jgi:hypothetical protein
LSSTSNLAKPIDVARLSERLAKWSAPVDA